jgi:hypothetical protein
LSIGKAGYFSPFEGIVDKWADAVSIDVLVVAVLSKGMVEVKGRLFDVLGQIHLLSK